MKFDYVCTYTRKQAIEDRGLFDVSGICKGIIIPVAITSAIRSTLIEDIYLKENLLKKDRDKMINDRIYNFLQKVYKEIVINKYKKLEVIYFDYILETKSSIDCYIKIHGGDNLEPVLTIMLSNED